MLFDRNCNKRHVVADQAVSRRSSGLEALLIRWESAQEQAPLHVFSILQNQQTDKRPPHARPPLQICRRSPRSRNRVITGQRKLPSAMHTYISCRSSRERPESALKKSHALSFWQGELCLPLGRTHTDAQDRALREQVGKFITKGQKPEGEMGCCGGWVALPGRNIEECQRRWNLLRS
jgi:hypothetical protein